MRGFGRWIVRLLSVVVVVLVVLVASACSGDPGQTKGVETGADRPEVDAEFAAWDVPGAPGCALAVARDGELVYSRGYGFANLDHDLAITPQTAFDVASITKQFVAASINLLAEEGKLSLDDDVRQWLPELPEYPWPITLRHMIYHTSGLRDYLNLFPLAGRGDDYPISHEQILAMMSRQRHLISAPGEQYRYSNTAYMLLAQVLERAGGQSLSEMVQERFFGPLEMAGSVMYDDRSRIIPRRATGYDRDESGRLYVAHNYNFDVVGDGQLYSTVEDLLLWDEFLHGSNRPSIHRQMLTEGQLNNGDRTGYAQGLRLSQYRGLSTVGHSGSSWGFRTELVRFLEPALSIAVACNADFASPGELAEGVADHYLAGALEPEVEASETDSKPSLAETVSDPPEWSSVQLAELVGAFYSAELDAVYRFSLEGGVLYVRIEQEPALEVSPIAGGSFEIRFRDQGWPGPEPALLAFDRDAAGDVTGFRLSSGTERGLVFLENGALYVEPLARPEEATAAR